MNYIFDLGNVLVDWNPDKFIEGYDISDRDKTLIAENLFGHSDWHALDKGTKTQSEVIASVTARSGMSEKWVKYCITEMKKSLATIDRSVEVLKKLSEDGHGLYCLSNMSLDTYEYIKDRPFFDYFDDMIISAAIKMMKPDAEIFEYALNRFNIKAEETVFIDDMKPNVMAAEKLNINCVHFKRTDDCYRQIMAFA